MAFLFPLADTLAGMFWLAGSPGAGYIVLRCAWPGSAAWNGVTRALVSIIVGAGWAAGVLIALAPGIGNTVSITPNHLAEFAAWAGMGLVLLTLLVSLVTHRVNRHFIQAWNPGMASGSESRAAAQPAPASAEKKMQPASKPNPMLREPVLNYPSDKVYKPSQLKMNPAPKPVPREAALEQNAGEDVLGLLRDEETASGRTRQAPPRPPSRAPMAQLSEFAGFEDTLTQLKRDLKDFNESVDSHSRKKRS